MLATAIHPRVRLPSQAGLSPNLGPLLDMPTRLLRHHSPGSVAVLCEGISHGLLTASVSAPDGEICTSEDLEKAAVWFVAVSKALKAASQ